MLLRWWKEYKERRAWQQFRKMYELHKQAEQFTSMRCPFCGRAAHSPEANFCHNCGNCFYTDPRQTVPSLHTTGPISLGERPFHAYRRALQQQQQQQQDVTNYPTQKFPAPRRPLRTVRLEGREHFG